MTSQAMGLSSQLTVCLYLLRPEAVDRKAAGKHAVGWSSFNQVMTTQASSCRVRGFTNTIALLIASTQIKDFLGLKTATLPSAFIHRMHVLVGHLNTISWPALAVSITSLAIIILLPRITERVPGSIVAMLACTIFVALLGLPIETIGTKFGGSRPDFPSFPFLTSKPKTSSRCFRRRPPWLSWRLLRVFCRLSSLTAGWNEAQFEC
jgi:hypothetical protein